ncbi:hypothetical protein AB0C87_24950 [Actinomadura sp. NPDC048021]|uniref:phage tail protein n=1 Tax=Actinomadura sp. NPDC048021 TaxID=3155385 RepID=UPI0033F9F7B2
MTGGAGGHEVERIAVKVVPDTGGFKEKLKAFLEEVEAGSKVEVEVELKGEAEAKAKLAELGKNLTATIKVELENLAEVRGQLANLARQRTLHLDVDIDTSFAKAKLDEISRNKGLSIQVDLDLQKARIELAVFLRPRTLTVHIDVDQNAFRQLRLHLAQMSMLSQGIARRFQDMGRTGQMAFRQVSGAAGQATSIFGSFRAAILPVLVVAVGLLVAALAGLIIALVAVVGGILAALPPLAFLAAGLVYAFKSGDKQAKSFRKSLGGIAKTAKSVLGAAVQPMMREFQKQIPLVQSWVAHLRGPLKTAFKESSKYIDGFSSTVMAFTDNLLKGINDALKDPNLQYAVAGFQNLIADIGTALGEFFKTLASGGFEYGETLNALGDSLIKLLPALARLANAFATVSPGIIDALTEALLYLFEVLGNQGNLKAIADAAKLSFFVIVGLLQGIVLAVRFQMHLWNSMWALLSGLASKIKSLWNSLVNWLKSKWNGLGSFLTGRTSGMSASVNGSFAGMVSGIVGKISSLVGRISSFWSRITGRTSSGANSTRAAAIGPFGGMASAISGIMSQIVGIVSSAWARISGIVSSIAGAVGRARSLVNGLSGLAGKVSPFNLFSAPVEGDGATPSTFSFDLKPPTEPMFSTFSGLDSLSNSVDGMAHVDRNLRRKYQGFEDRRSEYNSGRDAAQNVYNVEVNAAPTIPTEKTIVKALKYADALYAPA